MNCFDGRDKELNSTSQANELFVSKRGLEPLRPYERQPLKLVRLPISPLRRGLKTYSNRPDYLRLSQQ